MKFYFDGPPKLQINEKPKKLTKFILQKKFKVLDRKTRKYLNIYNSLHSQDSIARLKLPWKPGGKGLCFVNRLGLRHRNWRDWVSLTTLPIVKRIGGSSKGGRVWQS